MIEKEIRVQVVNTAIQYLNCNEFDGTHKQIIDIYNNHKPLPRGYAVQYTDPWCATFVSAVAIILKLTDIMPIECGCGQMIQLYQNIGSWIEDDAYIPQSGDVIFYDWEDNGIGDCMGYPDHVGIVIEVTGTNIKAIEGNNSNAVCYRNLAVDAIYIRGYGIPNYCSKINDISGAYNNDSSLVYIVREGDTLIKIAEEYQMDYQKLASYNGIINPDFIKVGDRLQIPSNARKVTYTVKKGDTLFKIASQFNTSVDILVSLNQIRNKDLIIEGQEIKIC